MSTHTFDTSTAPLGITVAVRYWTHDENVAHAVQRLAEQLATNGTFVELYTGDLQALCTTGEELQQALATAHQLATTL